MNHNFVGNGEQHGLDKQWWEHVRKPMKMVDLCYFYKWNCLNLVHWSTNKIYVAFIWYKQW